MIDLSIVIVNYNTRQLLLDSIASIRQHSANLSIEVIIVDNASTDDSPDAVRAQFPDVKLLANHANQYFSAANNQGIAAAQGRYVLALNPDTLIRGNALRQLVDYMERHETVGAATTTMFFPANTLQRNGSQNVTFEYLVFHYTVIGKLLKSRAQALNTRLWYPEWDRTSEREVGVLPGSAIIAKRAVWLSAGGFHEAMRMYFSDDYLSICIRRHGKKTVFVPTDGITHYENASTRQVSRRALNLYFRDLLAYTRLVFGRPAQIALAILLLPTWLAQWIKSK
ncbi:MAG: glycosyltransferase family 2 protein [Aggregatilineales bacterium]